MTNFVNFFEKNVNFLTFKWQFSGGSHTDLVDSNCVSNLSGWSSVLNLKTLELTLTTQQVTTQIVVHQVCVIIYSTHMHMNLRKIDISMSKTWHFFKKIAKKTCHFYKIKLPKIVIFSPKDNFWQFFKNKVFGIFFYIEMAIFQRIGFALLKLKIQFL